MSKPTNDEMHEILTYLYGPGKTLGDMLATYYSQYNPEYRATLQYDFYDNSGAHGTTVGDLANSYWGDIEYIYSNIELEDGTDFLMEDGSYIALETGNTQ